MQFSQENASDIRRYFNGSFVKFPQSGELLHYIEQSNDTSVRGKVYIPNDKGEWETRPFIYHLSPEGKQAQEVEFVLPRKSYFNYKGSAHILYRLPARQYHRGITRENTLICRLSSEGDFGNTHLDFECLNAYVGKQAFPKFEVREAELSYAVSRRVAVSSYNRRVFVDRVAVGKISYQGQGCIILENDIFLPEIQKLVESHGQSIIVKVADKEKKPRKVKVTQVLYQDEVLSSEMDSEF